MLQSRPITTLGDAKNEAADVDADIDGEVIVKGLGASPGI